MHRFFCSQLPNFSVQKLNQANPQIILSDVAVDLELDDARHAIKSLRLYDGDVIEVFNGQGIVAQGEVERKGRQIIVHLSTATLAKRLTPQLTVAASLPKASRADAMVTQLSQVGVDCLIPLLTQRSVVSPRSTKRDRLQKLCAESSKQCGNPYLLKIKNQISFDEILKTPAELKLIAMPGQKADLSTVPWQDIAHILVLIGPEGGWTSSEEQAALNAGFVAWGMGPYVMRIETAAVAAAGILRHAAMS